MSYVANFEDMDCLVSLDAKILRYEVALRPSNDGKEKEEGNSQSAYCH